MLRYFFEVYGKNLAISFNIKTQKYNKKQKMTNFIFVFMFFIAYIKKKVKIIYNLYRS